MRKIFLFNKNTENNKVFNHEIVDQYIEIARLVKEARIEQNLTLQELSCISKITVQTLNSIENNDKSKRPKYPFIRSILIKLEDSLGLKKNTLINLADFEKETFKKEKKDFIVSKFDLINTWQGSVLYFFILVLAIFILKRNLFYNVNVIEIQNIEKKSLINNLQ